MQGPAPEPDIAPGRLSAAEYAENFADAHAPLTRHAAAVASDRCYFCYDAPCVRACPTGIDIPSFIGKIATGNVTGAAHDILKENILGATCARVCPTEVLCEGACVRQHGEGNPVAIGALQRYATDHVFEAGIALFQRAPDSGKRVAVVGGGPAGLSCAHGLALRGHRITVFEPRPKLGGLNEYGIAAYKVVDGIVPRELRYLLDIGGIDVTTGVALGTGITLAGLEREYDAVFLGMGLSGVNSLGLEHEGAAGIYDAVEYIARLRQTADLATLPVGRRVVVIGGGMTAVDIATQTRRLGAEDVTMVYRRGPEAMGASRAEREWAQINGVKIKYCARPSQLRVAQGHVTGVQFEYTRPDTQGTLMGTGEHFDLVADMVFKATGQNLAGAARDAVAARLKLTDGRIPVRPDRRTALEKVWAGGDCVLGGQDLTVVAVEDGKRAAHAIDAYLRGQAN